MGHYISPSSLDVGDLTDIERDTLIRIFHAFVYPSAYPSWFLGFLNKPYTGMDQTIQLVLIRYRRSKNADDYVDELLNIQVTASTDTTVCQLCSRTGHSEPACPDLINQT